MGKKPSAKTRRQIVSALKALGELSGEDFCLWVADQVLADHPAPLKEIDLIHGEMHVLRLKATLLGMFLAGEIKASLNQNDEVIFSRAALEQPKEPKEPKECAEQPKECVHDAGVEQP